MKSFKVTIEDSEVKFFKDLLDKFDFVRYEEVEGFEEVRIYPGADFEIRSKKKSTKQNFQSDPDNVGQQSMGKGRQSKQDTMQDIRSVISKIDRLRDRSK